MKTEQQIKEIVNKNWIKHDMPNIFQRTFYVFEQNVNIINDEIVLNEKAEEARNEFWNNVYDCFIVSVDEVLGRCSSTVEQLFRTQ